MASNQEIDSAPCLYFTFRDDGIIQFVNQTLCDTLGYEKEKLINHSIEKIFPVSTRIFYNTHIFPLIKMSGRINEIFSFLLSSSGNQVPALLNGVRTNEAPFLNKFVAVVVESRNQFEQELIAAKNTAEKALLENEALLTSQLNLRQKSLELDTTLASLRTRHEELTQLNKVVTHDLEEPLRKMFFYSDQLKRELSGERNAITTLEKIITASKRLKSVVGALQEYVWIDQQEISLTEVNVNEIIADAIRQLSGKHNLKNVKFDITEIPPCKGEQLLLNKLFFHILDNAITYSLPGILNVITIRGSKVRRNAFTESQNSYKYVEYIKIEIVDKGRGFDILKGVNPFEIFKKLHVDHGLGMGLALSKKIVEKHFGAITAHSKTGEGTRIEMFLFPADD